MTDGYAKIREMLLHNQMKEVVAQGTAVVPVLIEALKDEANVQRKAAEALIRIGKPAVSELIDALKREEENVRMRVPGVLGEIAEKTEIDLRAVQKALEG